MSSHAEQPASLVEADVVAVATAIADEELYPAAVDVDRAAVVPARYLDRLADAGLYGLYGPASAGGLEADARTGARVVEALSGGSLAVTFIWIQHHGTVQAVAGARPEVRDQWLEPLCRGRVRSGVVAGALRRSGPPAIIAQQTDFGWILDGVAPWVTGWERIDVVYVGARSGDQIVWVLLDAVTASTLEARPLDLAAVDATSTVELHLDRHPVPERRVLHVESFADWQARDALGLRSNGYLPLGVAARCARLLDDPALAAEVDRARDRLDTTAPTDMAGVRADVSLLAVRAATAAVVHGGGRAVDRRAREQLLAREAMFLLVFAQTGAIRHAQLDRLAGNAP